MTKFIAIKFLLVSLFMISVPMETQAQTSERITFKRGASSATINGRITKDGEKFYVIKLKKNQKLTVELTKNKAGVGVGIFKGNGDEIKFDTDGDGYVEINTTYSGDYLIGLEAKYDKPESYQIRVGAY